jgi:hypothetical protein
MIPKTDNEAENDYRNNSEDKIKQQISFHITAVSLTYVAFSKVEKNQNRI